MARQRPYGGNWCLVEGEVEAKQRGRRQGFVEGKDLILLERQLDATQDLFDGEISSILAPVIVLLPSLDNFIRSRQHVRRYRQADLLRGLEIDHQLKFRRLLHRQIGGLGTFQDLIYIRSGAAV
jgi:hypothetical protein